MRRTLSSIAAASTIALLASGVARAEDAPNPAPEPPYAAMLVPSVMGVAYLPRADSAGAKLGAGAELLLLTWASNTDGFGPGQGKIRFDVAGLWDTRDSSAWTLLYRGGASVSFEGKPRRGWLVPYFSADIGGVHDRDLGGSFFVDPGGGLYLVYVKNFIVDAEAGYLFALAEPDLSGFKTHLTVSFALW
jgi:hypothetical protein